MVEVDIYPLEADDDIPEAEAGSCIGNIMANALASEETMQDRGQRAPGPPNPDINRLLSSPRRYPQMREYVKRQDFWRVPHFFRDMEADFDEEEEYIESLHLPDEAPKRRVRLLAQSERELLIQGLKQQFQKATASYLNATPTSRSKGSFEELDRIKQDIANLSHPYVFVEA